MYSDANEEDTALCAMIMQHLNLTEEADNIFVSPLIKYGGRFKNIWRRKNLKNVYFFTGLTVGTVAYLRSQVLIEVCCFVFIIHKIQIHF